ncbi:MAG: glycoside hydrolase family 57 [Verrucomicrobiota bacterium]
MPIHHALVLNFHQPPSNLDELLETNPWEVKEILFAMDRMPRALWGYEDVARVHLSMSGTLLETLSSPDFQERVYGMVKTGDLLWFLQNENLFEILGTGYYHPVLPLIPQDDWTEQMGRWRGKAQHLFWRDNFGGFWPPEMGFTMEMIPLLKQMGYQYVLVDDVYIEPVDGEISWQERRYRPHVAEYGGEEIIIVPRDRELSNAQLSGMDPGWFENEVKERTKFCDFEPLVTTASDGDNGGWFRNYNNDANFWYVFYRPFLNQARLTGEIIPAFIPQYIEKHGVGGKVRVKTGAWNTEMHYGDNFTQWTGTQDQKDALSRIAKVSDVLHFVKSQVRENDARNPEHVDYHLHEAEWHLLRAETSCNLYWGTAWVSRVHEDLDAASSNLGEVQRGL